MTDAFTWYLISSLLGWLTFPLAYRLLPGLPDRGLTASRALGLLLWSYFFWLLASLGILRNETGGLLLALTIVIALSAWALRRSGWQEVTGWLRSHGWLIVVVELLFLIAFAICTFVRAANPEAVGTEKPMELAFINAILGSPSFPPHDPWLSGYAISYYYFGYVMVAMLARLAGTSGGVAFNLGTVIVFSLSAIATFGLVYNLTEAYRRSRPSTARSRSASIAAGLFGPLFALIVSNLEGFLHALHTRGVFWVRDPAGGLVSSFWTWLDLEDLNLPPQEPFSWVPSRFWWWWRASRVVRDYDLMLNPKEIIDEFPFFSFLLADLHPHVLAMPFAFLVVTLALNLFLGGARGDLGVLPRRTKLRTLAWIGTLSIPLGILLIAIGLTRLRLAMAGLGILLAAAGLAHLSLAMVGLGILVMIAGGFILAGMRETLYEHGIDTLIRSDLGETEIGTSIRIDPPFFLLAALALGGMAFLNTWDFPFYVALFAAAYALLRAIEARGGLSAALKDFLWLGMALGLCGVLLYLPFYLGFSSQAGGVLPNLIYPTRGVHLWIMFAPLILPILVFLLYLYSRKPDRQAMIRGFMLAIWLLLALWLVSLVLAFAIVIVPQASELYLSSLAAPSSAALFTASFLRRMLSPGGWITLLVLLALPLALLQSLNLGKAKETSSSSTGESATATDSLETAASVRTSQPSIPKSLNPNSLTSDILPLPHLFALLLILWGVLLVTGPEFFYLRDQFGWRMNTIFKFYFQTWLIWAIAAAYASAFLLRELRRGWNIAFSLLLVCLLGMSLVYPAFSLDNKTNGFQSMEWSLDSSAFIGKSDPDFMAAVSWLRGAAPGVVAEAVSPSGGSYSEYARVSMLSGFPAVLGWIGHESQWRGGGREMGSRQSDLERLYCTRDWQEAESILDQYNIRYVFVGALERNTYRPNNTSCPLGLVEGKFQTYLKPVFQQGSATIYEYISPEAQ